MSDFDDAVERLTAWVRNYGDAKPKVFIGDVTMVLLAARDCQRLWAENSKLRSQLIEFGAHYDNCEWHSPKTGSKCDCGWHEAREAARAAGGCG